jgi:hypothetical protein
VLSIVLLGVDIHLAFPRLIDFRGFILNSNVYVLLYDSSLNLRAIQNELKQLLLDRGFTSFKQAVGYAHRPDAEQTNV